MSSGNNSATLETTQDFYCCCPISRAEFDPNGRTGIHIFNSIVLLLTSISATAGNFLMLVSIWRTPSLHSASNVLLFGLALTDLGVGLVVEPIFFVYIITKMKCLALVFCNSAIASRFTSALFCFASLFTMTAISVDMNIALYLHLRYKEVVTVKRMSGVLVGIWVCSITLGLLCVWYQQRLWMLWISITLLCLLLTMSAYYRVFRIVRYHQRQIDAQQQVGEQAEDQDEDQPSIAQRRKSLMNKFLIYCLMVLCYLPFVVMTMVARTTPYSVTNEAILDFTYVLLYLNSTLNPFVYCWRFHNIRAAVIDTTKKLLRQNSGQ